MSRGLREIAAPFVAAVPAGARVRTRLRVSPQDAEVLAAAGRHLGSLAGRDLAARCAEGRLDARGRAVSRAVRKRALTAGSSSRWAGAITRTSEDAWQLASRNLAAERGTLTGGPRRLSALIATAREHGARAVVIEDLDFAQAREQGREETGNRPSHGRRGRGFRRLVAGIPAAPEDAARPARARPRNHPAAPAAPRKPAAPRGTRQPPRGKTGTPHGTTAGTQAPEDRSRAPAKPAATIARC